MDVIMAAGAPRAHRDRGGPQLHRLRDDHRPVVVVAVAVGLAWAWRTALSARCIALHFDRMVIFPMALHVPESNSRLLRLAKAERREAASRVRWALALEVHIARQLPDLATSKPRLRGVGAI